MEEILKTTIEAYSDTKKTQKECLKKVKTYLRRSFSKQTGECCWTEHGVLFAESLAYSITLFLEKQIYLSKGSSIKSVTLEITMPTTCTLEDIELDVNIPEMEFQKSFKLVFVDYDDYPDDFASIDFNDPNWNVPDELLITAKDSVLSKNSLQKIRSLV